MPTDTTIVKPTAPLFDEAPLAIAGFLARYFGFHPNELQTRDDSRRLPHRSSADHQALPIWSIWAGSTHHEDGSVRPPHHSGGHGRVEEPGEESLVVASDDDHIHIVVFGRCTDALHGIA